LSTKSGWHSITVRRGWADQISRMRWSMAAVAQRHRGAALLDDDPLELVLDVVDGALGTSSPRFAGVAGEAAAEHDAGRLGQHGDVVAQALQDHVQHRGLAGAGTAGEHDQRRGAVIRGAAATNITDLDGGGHDAVVRWSKPRTSGGPSGARETAKTRRTAPVPCRSCC